MKTKVTTPGEIATVIGDLRASAEYRTDDGSFVDPWSAIAPDDRIQILKDAMGWRLAQSIRNETVLALQTGLGLVEHYNQKGGKK